MTQTLRAHFDGRVLVPHEQVDLPEGQTLEVDVRLSGQSRENSGGSELLRQAVRQSGWDRLSTEERLERIRRAFGIIVHAPVVPLEALRRENLYNDEA
jgi:hypothetical protein